MSLSQSHRREHRSAVILRLRGWGDGVRSELLTEAAKPILRTGAVTDMVSGCTITGAMAAHDTAGDDMAASEIGEPASVSGSAAGNVPAITFCGPEFLAQARSLAVSPELGQPDATELMVCPVSAHFTAHVLLSDDVAVVFGEAEPSV